MSTRTLNCRVRFGFVVLLLGAQIAVARAQTCYCLECPPGPGPSPSPSEPTYWDHNGSTMYLVADGDKREFRYHKPRQGMLDEGVWPGTVLFRGKVRGKTYEGTAYL